MFVRITHPAGEAWWNNRIGEVFEVEECFGSHYTLVEPILSINAYAIRKTCCVQVREDISNREAASSLDKEY